MLRARAASCNSLYICTYICTRALQFIPSDAFEEIQLWISKHFSKCLFTEEYTEKLPLNPRFSALNIL